MTSHISLAAACCLPAASTVRGAAHTGRLSCGVDTMQRRNSGTPSPRTSIACTARCSAWRQPSPAAGATAIRERTSRTVARGRKGMLAEIMDGGTDTDGDVVEDTKCPCGNGREYDSCCGALHAGDASAAAAMPEAITRARFSAYVKNVPEYVVSSTHPDSKDLQRKEDPEEGRAQLLKDAAATMRTVSFKKLSMKKVSDGANTDEQLVTYEVVYKAAGKKIKGGKKNLAERSRYRKTKEGEWKFFDALPLNANGAIGAIGGN